MGIPLEEMDAVFGEGALAEFSLPLPHTYPSFQTQKLMMMMMMTTTTTTRTQKMPHSSEGQLHHRLTPLQQPHEPTVQLEDQTLEAGLG